ncbi:MAG: HPF/RaiA family ribosome-associated protein [Alphaproteobacteria bacterium]|nr:HPF/RaiA family ribosome-associated protein [Alphaproteobacteria bacterium]
MQTPIQIDFQGMPPLDRLREKVEKYVSDLEMRYGRVTSCRVVLRAPGDHHRTGAPYEVTVRLALPNGKEVHVDRTRNADERHADANYAVHDAFRRARRRLQDHARRLSGQVKAHETQPIGTVRSLGDEYGFLETEDGSEVYFHRNSVLNDGFKHLQVGTRVTFADEIGEKGRQASTVRLLGKHTLR